MPKTWGDGIYELRVKFFRVNYRMLYFFHGAGRRGRLAWVGQGTIDPPRGDRVWPSNGCGSFEQDPQRPHVPSRGMSMPRPESKDAWTALRLDSSRADPEQGVASYEKAIADSEVAGAHLYAAYRGRSVSARARRSRRDDPPPSSAGSRTPTIRGIPCRCSGRVAARAGAPGGDPFPADDRDVGPGPMSRSRPRRARFHATSPRASKENTPNPGLPTMGGPERGQGRPERGQEPSTGPLARQAPGRCRGRPVRLPQGGDEVDQGRDRGRGTR